MAKPPPQNEKCYNKSPVTHMITFSVLSSTADERWRRSADKKNVIWVVFFFVESVDNYTTFWLLSFFCEKNEVFKENKTNRDGA
jgi:hypothetical protein